MSIVKAGEESTRGASPVGPVRQLVMQATPYCNLRCAYCYLPDRSDKSRMTLETVSRTARLLVGSRLLDRELDVRWHAGEPLSVGVAFYEQAGSLLHSALHQDVSLRPSVQTNGLLLNDAWMDLFKKWDFRVGVSIDGPHVVHDAYRLTVGAKGTLAAVERRLGLFRRHEVPLDVISVITTVTLSHVEEYLDYIAQIAPRSLGINVEESEGSHSSSAARDPAFADLFRQFTDRLLSWSRQTGVLVREFEAVERFLRSDADAVVNTQNQPGAILTVAVGGELTTFSPELCGQSHPRLRSLPIGNVHDSDIGQKLLDCGRGDVAEEIRVGVARCRVTCPYFCFCGGGAPANKLYENGTFASTETFHCRTTIMAFVESYLAGITSPQHRPPVPDPVG